MGKPENTELLEARDTRGGHTLSLYPYILLLGAPRKAGQRKLWALVQPGGGDGLLVQKRHKIKGLLPSEN